MKPYCLPLFAILFFGCRPGVEKSSSGNESGSNSSSKITSVKTGAKDDRFLCDGAQPGNYSIINQSIDTLRAKHLLNRFAISGRILILHTENVMLHAAETLEPNRHFELPLETLKAYKTSTALVIK